MLWKKGQKGITEHIFHLIPPGTPYSYTVSPSTSSGQRNRVSLASQPLKSVTLQPQPGGETTKSMMDMWWHWRYYIYIQRVGHKSLTIPHAVQFTKGGKGLMPQPVYIYIYIHTYIHTQYI
jgi:hypothetical protein